MVKNERPPSPESSLSPPPAKKARVSKTPATPETLKADSNGAKAGVWDVERCVALLESILDAGCKTADLQAIADKLGVTKSQVVDQLKPNRSNVRRLAIDLLRAKKGGV